MTGYRQTSGRWLARIAIALAAAILTIALGLHCAIQEQISHLLNSVGANLLRVTSAGNERYDEDDVDSIASMTEVAEVAGVGSTSTGYVPDAVYTLTYFEVSSHFASVMNLPFEFGQGFRDADSRSAILGHEVAQTVYGGINPVGQVLDGFSIVGVLEEIPADDSVREPMNRRVLVPLGASPAPRRSADPGYSMLWIRPASSLQQAVAAVAEKLPDALILTLVDQYSRAFTTERRTTQFLLFATSAIVLLALVIVAGTLSLSAVARRWELGVRMAIGARGRDVLRLLLVDSIRLTVEGASLGIAAGLVVTLASRHFAVPLSFGLSQLAVLPAFTVLGVISGIIPASNTARRTPASALRGESPVSGGRLPNLAPWAIVVASSAIVAGAVYLVLTFGAGTIHVLDSLWGEVDQRTLLVSSPRESILAPPTPEPADQDLLESLPSIAFAVPAIQQHIRSFPGSSRMGIQLTGVGPGYTQLGLLHLDSGRDLTVEEILGGEYSLVIHRDIAEDLFGTEDPLGRMIALDGRSYTVVGVFSSHMPVLAAGLWMIAPQASMPTWEERIGNALFWARLEDESTVEVARSEIVAAFRTRYPGKAHISVAAPTAFSDEIRGEAMQLILLLGLIAGAAALLGAVDVFNLIQIQLEIRRMELAIRQAVGATASRIVGLGAGQALAVAMLATPLGLALGMVGMAALIRAQSMEIRSFSWAGAIAAVAILVALSILSGSAAGWRASRDTPAEALQKGRT